LWFAIGGCTDADTDGYGVGNTCAGCLGVDCDDTAAAVHDTGARSCYTAARGAAGTGVCRSGLQACAAGAWGSCVGEIGPSGEACNNQDDDCNGQTDDALPTFGCGIGACAKTVASCTTGTVNVCTPGAALSAVDGPTCNGVDDDCDGSVDEDCKVCVPVDPSGNDGNADGTFANPFRTVQAAIDYAATNNQTRVCVAAGATCGLGTTFITPAAQTITMASGVSVYGRYESTTWTQCPTSTTTIQVRTPAGVTFPSTVTAATVLSGFTILRNGGSGGGSPPPLVSGITVDGAKNATIADVTITDQATGLSVYGVNLINGAQAIITRSRVAGGFGSVESIGVRSVGSTASVQSNCRALDAAGHCTAGCASGPSLMGRPAQGTGESYAVLLDNSPNSTVQQSGMCGASADNGAGIRIRGNGTGIVVRANVIQAFGSTQNSHGIWLTDCNNAAPWIVDNFQIAANGSVATGHVDGIRSVGACHPVIDSNVSIIGGAEGQTPSPNGVYCAANQATPPVASRCVVLGNLSIQGALGGFPPVSAGVRCDDGGCMRIAKNVITGRSGATTVGIWLGNSGTFVDNNQITGGCGATAIGVRSANSFARLQNNRIVAQTCAGIGGTPPTLVTSWGVLALTSSGPNEIDVHSNDIDGTGAGACTGGAVELGVTAVSPAVSGVGIFRNNILRAGACTTGRFGFHEASAAADPRFFQNNDFDPTGAPTALYFNENTTGLGTAAAVNALADMTSSGSISADPLFTAYPGNLHLQAGSPCINAGTATGAPLLDMDGAARDVTPDIGADER
jgi:hypothetical protein